MYNFVQSISTVLARVAGFAILGCALLICVEVTVRKVLGTSFVGTDEISGYVLAISVTWGLSLALVRRAHVRIDLLHARVPRPVAAVFDILALFSLLGVTVLFGWFATRLLMTSLRTDAVSNTPMQVPMWIPQSLWVAGFWVFACVTLVMIFVVCRALFTRDFAAASRMAGVRGSLDEAQEELAEVEARR